ncbi:MAG: hypothetical protein LCH43_11440 [Actinobacteria bacterium]|nr:hypothetical protein [Actinomycetota bacterium]
MSGLGVGLGPFDQLAPESAQHVQAPGTDVPVTIMTIPKAWVLVMPCGCIDGIVRGSVRNPTAEAAWATTFTPNKRSRDAQDRKGWTVRAATTEDIERAQHAPDHEGHNS